MLSHLTCRSGLAGGDKAIEQLVDVRAPDVLHHPVAPMRQHMYPKNTFDVSPAFDIGLGMQPDEPLRDVFQSVRSPQQVLRAPLVSQVPALQRGRKDLPGPFPGLRQS